MFGQTRLDKQAVHIQIRLLLEVRSDRGLDCLISYVHLFEGKATVEPYIVLDKEMFTARFVDVWGGHMYSMFVSSQLMVLFS